VSKFAVRKSYTTGPEGLNVKFCLGSCIVKTVNSYPTGREVKGFVSPFQSLVEISTRVEMEEFDGAHEAARYSRPVELSIFGILSFLTGHSFTVFDIVTRHECIETTTRGVHRQVSRITLPKFVFNGTDHTQDLSTLLRVVTEGGHRAELLLSLLDRWRRASILLSESKDGLRDEEAFLGFFHVLELLVREYEGKQRSCAEARLRIFIDELLANEFKFRGPKLVEQKSLKLTNLKEFLLGPDSFTIAQRILFMLEELEILDLRMHRLIGDYVGLRNEIAHGRVSYRSVMVWPLRPHFSIYSQHSNLVKNIPWISARLIAANFGLMAWSNKWKSIIKELHPPYDIVKEFVKNNRANSISRRDFNSGTVDFVRPNSIAEACLQKKINLSQLENCLGDYLLGMTNPKKLEREMAYVIVLLCDANNPTLATHCQKIYQSLTLEYFGVTNEKDILRNLEDRDFTLNWLRIHITTNGSREHLGPLTIPSGK
jgi:hypothetical protein